MSRIVVDPVTRIEGHLRVEVQVDGGRITDAWSSSTMWRGIEQIVSGRDPRDAWYFAQRICGVCTTVHALASVRAVEDALGIVVPPNAHLLRDLINVTQFVHDHVVHFYHLHALDWVDITSALTADPRAAAKVAGTLSDYPRSSAPVFTAVQKRMQAFVKGGRLGPFANGYWGHPAYRLPPEVNLVALSHYLDALEFQRDYARIQALLGGKNPHPQTYLVGGMATPIDLTSEAALNAGVLTELRDLARKGLDFVRQAYLPDLLAVAKAYPEWTAIGRGLGNYLVYGDLVANPDLRGQFGTGGLFPGGLIRGADLSTVEKVDQDKVAEWVSHSWYEYDKGDVGLHPYDGQTTPNYTGPKPPYEHLDVARKYSWLKAPRYDGLACEVGPLARVLVAYAKGDKNFTTLVDGALTELKAGPEALFSTLGRTLARGLETQALAEYSLRLIDQLRENIGGGDLRVHNGEKWEPGTWPDQARGVGFLEAPRGSLAHWVVINDQKVERYQVVVPSTWNGSPRDADGKRGAYEAALIGTPVADPARPLEVLRTVHSFDPCMACAAHVIDADGEPIVRVRVQ